MVYIDDRPDRIDLDAALRDISAQRRQQALSFSHEAGRRLCVAAYLLLKQGLRQEYGLTGNPLFAYDANGKPRLADRPDICFNLSHCRVAVACAIGPQPVGIDIESVRPYKPQLARYTMNDAELQLIEQAERPDVAFTRLWTMKEARLKLTGEGLRTDLRQVLTAGDAAFTTVVDPQLRFVYSVCTGR